MREAEHNEEKRNQPRLSRERGYEEEFMFNPGGWKTSGSVP